MSRTLRPNGHMQRPAARMAMRNHSKTTLSQVAIVPRAVRASSNTDRFTRDCSPSDSLCLKGNLDSWLSTLAQHDVAVRVRTQPCGLRSKDDKSMDSMGTN
ncbi:hypothetical protein CSAL01_11915 [Colletotrichum salicis]|uniref:Uncharacterized protein n=1 Tax=Colletotrichum salicis TaxID=1209931 RepID=A0A135UG32_9PEZI|nr:hypothetical protein CSAL01_11915 [Colletotrichum salicis]